MHKAVLLHQQGMSVNDIALNLGISAGRVYQIFRSEKYSLPKYNASRGVKKLWSQEELDYLRNHPDKPIGELAKDLGRGYGSVKSKLRYLDHHRFYRCIVCEKEISQKGKYCKEHNRIERRISQTLNRCKTRGMSCDLSEEEMITILTSKCHYCGTSEHIGMDRVDSKLGYVKSNVVSCCSKCNVMKMDLELDDWYAHMRKILEYSDGK